jgi:uncharacterized RDD family membrane protein YckC
MTTRARPLAPVESRRIRGIITPEGIPLRLEVARAGDRAAGFVLDFLLLMLAAGLTYWIITTVFLDRFVEGDSDRWLPGVWFLLWFLIRTFYFTFFELRSRGSTPGKRKVGIRVMDAGGGPLTSDAIVVRNLMREIEVWLPLVVLVAPKSLLPDAPGWINLAAAVWILALALFPLFNRDRLRIGDMVAGTMVVEAPKATLLPDLGGQEVRRQEKRKRTEYEFTDKQLGVYGIYELQVLEDLLRRDDPHKRAAMEAVAKRIAKKISWKGAKIRPERFLREFYAALRGRLEGKMLLGKRKADKYSKE